MKRKNKRSLALFLVGTLLAGILPIGTGVKSRAAEQITLRNPRILKTTQEVALGTSEKKELKNPTTENGVTTWDCIWFGNYWQEDTNGDGKADKNDAKTPIKWRVLSVDGDDAFLVADKNLDCQKYDDKDAVVTWETCTMRSWLNGYGSEANRNGKDYSGNNFLNNAFSIAEQSTIRTTNVVNENNPDCGTWGGNDTMDKVYLLSIDEVKNTEYGFMGSTETRLAVNTAYTADGGETGSKDMYKTVDYWWLRSPGLFNGNEASRVDKFGNVNMKGDGMVRSDNAVRPALHLKISSDSGWSYAGIVSSDDVAEWDCIWFGNYWQKDTNGDYTADEKDVKTPIKWRVLSVKGNDVFLLADKNLDMQKYNDTGTDVTWETSTMRSWLNGYGAEKNTDGKDFGGNNFLHNAFSVGEQSIIRTIDVVNNNNQDYGTVGGNDTSDKVYLLSIDEVTNPKYGFNFSEDVYAGSRRARNTAFASAKLNGAPAPELGIGMFNNAWWLRSPGHNSECASIVQRHGGVDGYGVDASYVFVRPALHLNLSSNFGWSYAGTVTSDGGGEEIEVSIPIFSPSPTLPGNTQTPQETMEPEKTVEPDVTEKPLLSPSPTLPGITQTPQETVEPGSTLQPSMTEQPFVSPMPTTSGNTQTPQETTAPGTPFQPGTSSVVPPAPHPSFSVTPSPNISSDPGKGMIRKVSALKLKQKNHTVTVSWKKLTGVKGYQICYSTSKKWKGKKQKLITKNNAVIKSLRKKKTYYFRVRAYRLEGTKKVYGAWSATKRITIKR